MAKKKNTTRDRHALYEAAVQAVESDIDFIERVYKKERGRAPRLLREDFCGTAAMACEFVRRHKENRSWGVDLDQPTLEWGREHRLAPLGDDAERVELVCADVRSVVLPQVDVQAAFNFSYFTFKERGELKRYFQHVHRSLLPGGMLFLDLFGGTESFDEVKENSKKDGETQSDGRRVEPFTYTWEQAYFNPIDHHIVCHMHFRLRDGKKIRRAFTYDWRFWTLPELGDLLAEVGFSWSKVYVEGWDEDEDEGDGIFRHKTKFDNEGSWVAYLAGGK